MKISILQLRFLRRNAVADLNALLREFRPGFEPPDMRQWRGILAQKDIRVFVVREKTAPRQARGKIVGMAILRWHELPIGRAGTLEDVVVSSNYRGKGYGAALMKAIVDFAKKQKLAYIDLTTRPQRKAANKLYQKFGWERRRTNVYRLSL